MSKVSAIAFIAYGFFMTFSVNAQVNVAVAANFRPTLELLVDAYKKQHPKADIHLSTASTGVLYAQIERGAPFDIFLSADSLRPKTLENTGKVILGTRKTYALGQLVLWMKGRSSINARSLSLLSGKLAMANPKLAPFGLAAKQTLQKLGLFKQLRNQIVLGNSVAQVAQYVETGASQAGFVALSQVLSQHPSVTDYWLVPSDLYSPIEQQVIIIKQPSRDEQANQQVMNFYRFILSAPGQDIIMKNGYLSVQMRLTPPVSLSVQ
ncbi:molybdate ABC transporter substrate-binding protein [uncultured Paraglaciecola sp.]|uniref:molybdate ABC transporter substrate-binding protein n=1 Tax=uncultured Paraglaciecola sp. TaxID=1765024 RepID=UPI0030DCA3CA|tara:strand:- start:1556 stop:2350 length:795 start_codon:yes stop_codon:yes gene_type:complete